MVKLPNKVLKGAIGEQYHRAAIEIATDLWEAAGLEIKDLPLIYVTLQRAGYARLRERLIQVPTWIFRASAQHNHNPLVWGGVNFSVYYIAHELAHHLTHLRGGMGGHGPDFMAALKEICPPEYQGYEYGYQPQSALASGVERRING